MIKRVYVIGVGQTPFVKPSARPDWDYPDMVREAVTDALSDAGIGYDKVQQCAAGYCFADTTSGQRAIYEMGLTGIPVVNVNNACASGSSAIYLMRCAILAGLAECALAVGFEKMNNVLGYEDRAHPLAKHIETMAKKRGFGKALVTAQLFGNAGREHMEKYGTNPESFARISVKNSRHAVHNRRAQFSREYTLEEVMNADSIYDPLTKYQCCPTSNGAGAAILASEQFVKEHGLAERAVEIVDQELCTDLKNTFDGSDKNLVGAGMTEFASQKIYNRSGIGPENIDVIELHDCFSTNELITYESLGLCDAGKGADLIDSGATTYGGKWVVNPSGGLLAKGHPIGATGLAQCAELVWQLRGEAGKRQVDGARTALQHNLGLGSAAVVTLYCKDLV
jgi:acetyl-CoA acyltransferase